jgi:hypothetical protein
MNDILSGFKGIEFYGERFPGVIKCQSEDLD